MAVQFWPCEGSGLTRIMVDGLIKCWPDVFSVILLHIGH